MVVVYSNVTIDTGFNNFIILQKLVCVPLLTENGLKCVIAGCFILWSTDKIYGD